MTEIIFDPEIISASGERVITVAESISSLNEQYVNHIFRASIILLLYSLYNFYIMMPRIEERSLKNVISFHFNTVALVMSLFLFVISLTYNGWLKL